MTELIFWDIGLWPGSVVHRYQYFRGTNCLHLEDNTMWSWSELPTLLGFDTMLKVKCTPPSYKAYGASFFWVMTQYSSVQK